MSSRYEKEENGERGADQTMGPEKKEKDGRGGLPSVANRTMDEKQKKLLWSDAMHETDTV